MVSVRGSVWHCARIWHVGHKGTHWQVHSSPHTSCTAGSALWQPARMSELVASNVCSLPGLTPKLALLPLSAAPAASFLSLQCRYPPSRPASPSFCVPAAIRAETWQQIDVARGRKPEKQAVEWKTVCCTTLTDAFKHIAATPQQRPTKTAADNTCGLNIHRQQQTATTNNTLGHHS